MTDGTVSFSRKPTDADDVAWALSTAESLWSRGERVEALRWVRRAAEGASDAGDDDRALELAKLASALSAKFSTPPPPSVAPPPPSVTPPTALAPPPSTTVPTPPPSTTVPAPTPGPAARRPSASPPRPSTPKPSFASTLPAARSPAGRRDREPTTMSGPPEPTMLSGGPLSPPVPSEPPTTRDTNPPTDGFSDEATATSAGVPVPSQATRVFVVQADGGARVLLAPPGATPPRGAVEAMLVALSADVDWRRLLG